MSYDYSSENQRLELPNPYRVQNLFLFTCAAVLTGAGITALLWARAAWQGQTLAHVVAPLLVSVVLLICSLGFAITAAKRLKFFFGRGRPASLAPEINVGGNGNSEEADQLKNTLRQGGLAYPEPQGALNGLLYHGLPRLITAPLVVQTLTQRHFFNALAFFITALSFAVAWGLFGTENTRPLVSMLFLVFAAVVLLRPLLSGGRARMGTAWLVGLIVVAVMGPLAAGLLGPSLPPVTFSVHAQTFLLLSAASMAVGMTLMALLAQLDGPPATERSCEQVTLSMNGPPGALITELDRRLQESWSEKIPNRCYTRIEPETQGAAGSGRFAGEVLEESQPLPLPGTAPQTLGTALAASRHRWMVLLDIYGTLLVFAAVYLALSYVRGLDPALVLEGGLVRHAYIGHAVICLMVAGFAFQSASAIWGRFNFESVLLWVEMQGVWQSSRVGTGNQLSSQLQTQNDVVRVESMTLRVWRARIESVVFGKDSGRQVMAMFGTSEPAKQLAQDLTHHANQQSIFIAPRAQEDERRIAGLQAAANLISAGDTSGGLSRAGVLQAARNDDVAVATSAGGASSEPVATLRFCAACGAKALAAARFCADCGKPMGA
jgi:hypothetical protein